MEVLYPSSREKRRRQALAEEEDRRGWNDFFYGIEHHRSSFKTAMARCKILQTFPLSVSAPPLQIINLIFEFVQKAKEEKKSYSKSLSVSNLGIALLD